MVSFAIAGLPGAMAWAGGTPPPAPVAASAAAARSLEVGVVARGELAAGEGALYRFTPPAGATTLQLLLPTLEGGDGTLKVTLGSPDQSRPWDIALVKGGGRLLTDMLPGQPYTLAVAAPAATTRFALQVVLADVPTLQIGVPVKVTIPQPGMSAMFAFPADGRAPASLLFSDMQASPEGISFRLLDSTDDPSIFSTGPNRDLHDMNYRVAPLPPGRRYASLTATPQGGAGGDHIGTGRVTVTALAAVEGELAIDAPGVPIALAAGQVAKLAFHNPQAGRRVSLGLGTMVAASPGVAHAQVRVSVLAPGGEGVTDVTARPPAMDVDLGELKEVGDYRIVLDAGGAPLQAVAMLSTDAPGTLVPEGSTVATIARVGQHGLLSFAGSSLRDDQLRIGPVAFGDGLDVRVKAPSGRELSQFVSQGETRTLSLGGSEDGRYDVFVLPAHGATGSVPIALLTAPSTTLRPGAPPLRLRATRGHPVRRTLDLAIDKSCTVNLTGLSPRRTPVTLTIAYPGGTHLFSQQVVRGDTSVPLLLPESGSWVVTVDAGRRAASFKLQAIGFTAATLADVDQPVVFHARRFGQAAMVRVTAPDAGSVLLSASTFRGEVHSYPVHQLAAFGDDGGTAGRHADAVAMLLGSQRGYRAEYLAVVPRNGATGSIRLTARKPLELAVPLDGDPLRVGIDGGRLALLSLPPQARGVGVTGLATRPGGATMRLKTLSPSGGDTEFLDAAKAGHGTTAGGGWRRGQDPARGWQVIASTVAPRARFEVIASPDAGRPATIDGPPIPMRVRTGQPATFRFTADARRVGIGVVDVALEPASAALTVDVHAPGEANVSFERMAVAGSGTGELLPELTPGRTYDVFVDPHEGRGRYAFQLVSAISGTLATDGAPLVVKAPRAGQAGELAFDGAAGQALQLEASDATFADGLDVTVHEPRDQTPSVLPPAVLAQATIAPGESGHVLALPPLPSTGRYSVLVVPAHGATGAVAIALKPRPD